MRIFVTLGTQNKSFARLLRAIDESQTSRDNDILVQAGYTDFSPTSPNMELFSFCSEEELERHIEEADLVITHAGIGSITRALAHDKRVIAAARQSAHGEMGNDHQHDILQAFARKGYLIPLEDFTHLEATVAEALHFTPQPYVHNIDAILATIIDYIDTH